MKAEEKSLNGIFGGEPKKLIVPFFQRRYVWEKENWKELLESIEESSEVQVFLGSIIIKWGKNREPSEATIVDGQQRLTTISLLTKAIYDEFSNEMRENVKSTVKNVLFYKEYSTDDENASQIKIEHSRVDREAYEKIIRAGVFNDSRMDLEELEKNCPGQISRCYCYYRRILHKKQQLELKNIFKNMYNDSNKMLVRIELQENDVNEQSIFDTINRAGARLSTADIIKNNLFKGFMESCGNDQNKILEVNRIYDEKWDRLFYSEEGENEWDKKRRFGNVEKNNLEFLLYCVASIKWAKEDTKDFSGRLETVYTNQTENYTYDQYKSLINDIHEYAKIFHEHITRLNLIMSEKDRTERENEYFSNKDDVRRLLLILEEFGVQMFYPFVLKILKEANGDLKNKQLSEQSKVLESFVIRRRIVGGNVSEYTSKCNLILNKGVKKLFTTVGEKEISISNIEVKNHLTQVKPDTAKMLLFLIELSRRNKNSDIEALTYTYTLEHIMPQKWQMNWAVSEDMIENRQKHVGDLGNMTLLRGSLNSTVKNSDFITKIEGIPAEGRRKKKEGYMGNTSLYITEEIVEQYRKGMTEWNEKTIDERRNRLSEEIITLWPLYKENL